METGILLWCTWINLSSTRSQKGGVTLLHFSLISSAVYRLVADNLIGRLSQLWQSSIML